MAPSGTFWVTTALAPTRVGRVGTAQSNALIGRHIIANISGLSNHGKAMIDKQVPTDFCTGVNIDRGEKSRDMIDQPGKEIKFTLEQPMRQPMEADGQNTGI